MCIHQFFLCLISKDNITYYYSTKWRKKKEKGMGSYYEAHCLVINLFPHEASSFLKRDFSILWLTWKTEDDMSHKRLGDTTFNFKCVEEPSAIK